MADLIFDVDGPILVEYSENLSAWDPLGHSPNDDRPRWEQRPILEELGSDETGDEVIEAVYAGCRSL